MGFFIASLFGYLLVSFLFVFGGYVVYNRYLRKWIHGEKMDDRIENAREDFIEDKIEDTINQTFNKEK